MAKTKAKVARTAAKPVAKKPVAKKPAKSTATRLRAKPTKPTATKSKPATKQSDARQRSGKIARLLEKAGVTGAAGDTSKALPPLALAGELANNKKLRRQVQTAYQTNGNRHLWRQEWEPAIAYYQPGVALYEDGDETQATAEMAAECGFSLLQLRRVDEGERMVELSRELHQAANRMDGVANAYYYLSSVAYERLQMDLAVELARKAVAASAENGNERGVAFHSYALGRALYEQGHTREADEVARTALEIAKRNNLGAVEGNLANMIANVALDDHKLDEAETHYERALELFQQARLPNHEAITIANLGNLAADEARYDDALDRYEIAFKRYDEVGEQRLAAITHTARASVYTEIGRYADAHAELEVALATMTVERNERRVSFVRAGFARLAEAQDQLAEARAHYAESEMSLESAGDMVEVGRMLYAAAGVEADLGDPESAETLLARAAALDPASLASVDETGRGEKRAGMEAVRTLKDLALGRIEMARARHAGPDEARAYRAAAEGRLDRLENTKHSLIERSAEVRRVAARLRAQLSPDAKAFQPIAWSGSNHGTGWECELEIDLVVGASGEALVADLGLRWDGRKTQAKLWGPKGPASKVLRGTLEEQGGNASTWEIRLELVLEGAVVRGRLVELTDDGGDEEMCAFGGPVRSARR